jgi:hypothetical protein
LENVKTFLFARDEFLLDALDHTHAVGRINGIVTDFEHEIFHAD